MQEIGAFAAKTHLSQLLSNVCLGETYAITRHGRVIAYLTPAEAKPQLDIAQAISGIMSLRKKITKRGIKVSLKEIQQMKNEGRK